MIDLHTHSNRSDGTVEPATLIRCATDVDLKAVAITDHDTLAGYDEAVSLSSDLGIVLVCGIELTALYANRTIHLLGYFLRSDPCRSFRGWLRYLQEIRRARNRRIIEKLLWHGCAVTLDESPLGSVVGRPHIAKALVERGYSASISDAFEKYLGESAPCYERVLSPTLRDAIERTINAQGLPVLAHPGRYGMQKSEFEPALKTMIDSGLQGLEVFHSEHTKQQTKYYQDIAFRYHLAPTGGSDFHGESKPLIRLGTGIDASLHVQDAVLWDLYQHQCNHIVRSHEPLPSQQS